MPSPRSSRPAAQRLGGGEPTDEPGALASDALADNVWRPLTQHRPLRGKRPTQFVSGKGSTLVDEEGRHYLDAVGGVLCVNVGYGRQELADAAARQFAQLSYLAPGSVSRPTMALAGKLQDLLGIRGHVYFSVSGSEANEAAFKIARQYHTQSGEASRFKIISRYRAYHGNTLGAMSATGQAERKIGYEPGAPGFLHIHPPYPYRSDPRLSLDEHGREAASWLEDAILHEGEQTVAAFIMEPIISGGGVLIPPDSYIPLIREICTRHGVLLIFDEVVSGFGRTGRMFGFEHWGQHADIYTLAKGIASAYMPLGATFVKETIFERFDGDLDGLTHFRHINTYGGHPVAAAVALENIRIIEQEGLPQRARVLGEQLLQLLQDRIGSHPNVGEIRGLGLLTGIELVEDRETKTALSSQAMRTVLDQCKLRGVIVGRNGNTVPSRANVLLLAPPLVVSESELVEIVDAIGQALGV